VRLCQCGCAREISKRAARFLRGHSGRKQVRWVAEDRGFTTTCWIWQLAHGRGGYGVVKNGRRMAQAHVVEWERVHGPKPEGHDLDHLCQVRNCVNPAHLEAVTRTVNIRRSRATKLTEADVLMIRASAHRGTRQRYLAGMYGVSQSQISRVVRGEDWK